jgi:hypothetical protein
MTDPTRWRSDPSRRPTADLLLRAVRCPRSPAAADLARLSKVVCDIPRRAALRRRRVARALAGVAGLVLSASLATSVWAWRRAEDGARAVASAPRARTPETRRREPVRSSGRPTAVVPPRAIVRRLARHHAPSAAVQPARAEARPPLDLPDPLTRETELIAAARSEIGAAPGAALASLDDHRREFPGGQLAPEREFLVVDALRRLHRIGEARERALELSRRFPSSSYGVRATQLLELAR